MAPSHPRSPKRKRIEIDTPFAAVPQALLLDTAISAAACRLWGVLFVFHWNDTPPDFDKLATALNTTERSVYRWLQELEACEWIGWHRNKGVPDRFTLHMRAGSDESDTAVNLGDEKLTQVSKKLIPRSKRLTQVSEELTQVSISALLDGSPMPQSDRLSSDQKIQKIQNGDGDGRTLAFLTDMGIGAAKEFAHLPFEQTKQDYYNRKAANQTNAIIVKAWRSNPPTKDYCYAEQPTRSVQPDVSPDRPRRSAPKGSHAPTGGAELRDPGWMDREIAAAEARARSEL